MKILFIGSVHSSQLLLDETIKCGGNISAILTKEASTYNADFVDLAQTAKKNNIAYKYLEKGNDSEITNWAKEIAPDYIFCFGWSHLLPTSLLEIPRKGSIGFHPAALPKNRGRHPIIWSLALGLKSTASTFFYIKEKADTGNILVQEKVLIKDEDYAQDLYNKIMNVAVKQIPLLLKTLSSDENKGHKQDESKSNSWRKRTKQDGLINFNMAPDSIYNLVRSLSAPYIGAHLTYKENDVKVWKTRIEHSALTNLEPGKVLDINKSEEILVKCLGGAIWLTNHEFNTPPEVGDYLI